MANHRFDSIVRRRHELYTVSIQNCLDIVFALKYLNVPPTTLVLFERAVVTTLQSHGCQTPTPVVMTSSIEQSLCELQTLEHHMSHLSRIQLPMLGYLLNMKRFNDIRSDHFI